MADGRIEKNDIVTDEAINNITTLKIEIENSAKALSDLTKQLTALNDSTGKYTVSTKALADYEKKLSDIEKELERTNAKLIESKKKHKDEVDKLSKTYILQAKERQDAIKLAKAEAVANNELAGTEERQRARLAQLTIEKSKLRKEDENYAVTLDKIQKEMNDLDAALIKSGSTMQKQKANVGNYTGANWGLSNSINQLTREAPAFANSINTGFMALSNNIPILVDNLQQIRQQNKLLREDGQQTVPVLKQFLGAFLSWNTLLSVGVTLLTVYGGKIIEYLGNLTKTNEAIKKQNEYQKELNTANIEAIKNSIDERTQLNLLYNASQNQNLSLSDRKIAVDELQKQFPHYFGNLTDEEILVGKATKAYNEQVRALLEVARAQAYKAKIEENAKAQVDIEETIRQLTLEEQIILNKRQAVTVEEKLLKNKIDGLDADEKISRLADISVQRREQNALYAEKERMNNELASKIKIEYLIKETKAENDISKAKNKSFDEHKKQQEDYVQLNEQYLANNIKIIKSDDYTTANYIENTKTQLKALRDFVSTSDLSYKEQAEAQQKINDQIKELSNLEFQYMEIKKMSTDQATQSLLNEYDIIKQYEKDRKNWAKDKKDDEDAEIERRKRIVEIYQRTSDIALAGMQLYNAIIDANITKQEYAKENELKLAQRNYDKNIEFGMNEVQAKAVFEADKNSIEIKYQKKIDQLKRKQAIWQKAQDISQIITNGAMAQIAIWANPLTILAAPVLSVLLAALTALQLATVAMRPIPPVPEYWAGTKDHIGGLAIVGDKFGTEMIELPTGEKYLTPNTETLVDLPAHTKVIPNKDLIRELANKGIDNVKDITGSKMIVDAINNKPFAQINLDKTGFSNYIVKAHERKKYIDNKYRK